MGKLILITGGARSGKSIFAEKKVAEFGNNILYIATARPSDDEMVLRVEKHRKQRPSDWVTMEIYEDMAKTIDAAKIKEEAILLDCVTIMVANLFFENDVDWENLDRVEIETIENKVAAQISNIIKSLTALPIPVVAVTNEIGMGIVTDNKLSRVYRDIVGKANQSFAKAASEVYMCVSGIPICIKE